MSLPASSSLADESQSLREELERLRLALASSGTLGTFDMDLLAGRVFADETFARFFSLPRAEAAQGVPLETWVSRIHAEDRERMTRELEGSIQRRSTYACEYRVLLEGRMRWLLARGQVHLDAQGQPVRLPGTVVDITERKQRELRQRALLDMTERFHNFSHPEDISSQAAALLGQLLDVARAGYVSVDYSGWMSVESAWSSPTARVLSGRFTGASANPVVKRLQAGETVAEQDIEAATWIPEEFRAVYRALPLGAFVNVPLMRGGHLVGIAYAHTLAPRAWSEEDVAFVRDVAGRTWMALERVRAEQALREAHETLERRVEERTRERERIWTHCDELMAVAGFDGYLKAINPAGLRLIGLDEETVLKLPFMDITHPEDLAAVGQSVAGLARGERFARYEARMRLADGTYRVMACTAVLGDGVFYVIGRDVTAEREDALLQKRLFEVMARSPELIGLFDPQSQTLDVNAAVRALMGF